MILGLAFGLIFLIAFSQAPEKVPQEGPSICFAKLKSEIRPYAERLVNRVKEDLKDRVPEEYLKEVFCREELSFSPEIMLKSLIWKEAKLPYGQFFEEERVLRARDFIQKNKELLDSIEKHFQVDKEVIVAIFLVETDLGRKTGQHRVLNTFFSLALTGDEDLFRTYLQNQPEIDFSNETTRKRWEKRKNWAYQELLHFLEIAYKNQWDPYEIRGSIFGAFGYPQFVPKSYVVYGYDWDGDGKVDLYSVPDALSSIANYLQKEGYKSSAERKEKKRIIMKYNISEPYAETVLKIAELLKDISLTQKNEIRGN